MPRAPNSAATSGLRADRRIRFGVLCRICAPKRTSVSVSCCATVPVSRQTARSVLPFLRASDRHRARKSACPHVGPLFRTQTLCSIRGHPRRRADQRVHVRNSGPRPQIAGPAAAGHHRHRGDRTPDATREDTSQAPNGDTKAVGQAVPVPPQLCLFRLPQSAPRPVCRLPADSSR